MIDGTPQPQPDSRATPPGASHDRSWLRRFGHIALAFVIGAAVTGYFVGLNNGVVPHRVSERPVVSTTSHGDAPRAVSYAELYDADLGPNAGWSSRFPPSEPRPAEEMAAFFASLPPDAAERRGAVEARAQRRAFSGAPPVVPHAIDQVSAASCLVCHGEGLRVGQVAAPPMSHELLPNCVQCHVESTNRATPPAGVLRIGASRFEGLATPGPGERAWPGAPPTIPHTTWMRENCFSCHGTLAQEGLRTSHPWRTNCVQCHASSATLDQMQVFNAERPPVARSPAPPPTPEAQP